MQGQNSQSLGQTHENNQLLSYLNNSSANKLDFKEQDLSDSLLINQSKVNLTQKDDQKIQQSNESLLIQQSTAKLFSKDTKQKKMTKKVDKVLIQSKENQNKVVFDQVPIGSSKNGDNKYDQVPIGKSGFNMSQFPEGEQPQEVAQTNYPMAQKLKSKAVKLRLSGFEDLLSLITNDPNSSEFSEIDIGKLMKQTNPACLQKILQCYKAWLDKGKQWGQEEARNAIESGYINGKANTKKLTVEILDEMYEQKADCLQTTILTGLNGKVPKVLAGYIAIINQLLTIYGVKKMKFLKPYLGQVVRVINNQKLVAVKTQGGNLLKQAYKWMGKDTVQPLLKNLKEATKKQLDTFWESYDQTQVMTAPKDKVQENINPGKANKKIDAYQIADAVDIFKQFNQKWSESVLKAQKWNQKVRLMQQFITAASVPKIANTDGRHVNQLIKRLINDSNFNVVLMDLKILAVLSKGIRRPFAPVVKSMFSSVIGKFRDKKTQMVDETFHTLNDFMYCISIEEVTDDLKQGLADKAPNMKVNLISWIGKFVQKKVQQKGQLPQKACEGIRVLFPMFEKLLSDGTSDVRDCMAKTIAKMKLLIDQSFFQKIQGKMSKNLASKVQNAKENMKSKQKLPQKDRQSKQLDKSTIQLSQKQQKQHKMTKTLSKSRLQQPKDIKKLTTQSDGKVDLTNQIQKLFPKLNDNQNWQNRKESAEAIINLINDYAPKIVIYCVPDLLATLKVRINDTNKQLIKTFVHLTGLVFCSIPQKQAKLNAKNFICQLAEGLSDKVDANRKEIHLALNRIGDAVGKQYVLGLLGQYLEGDKDSRAQIINFILSNQDYLLKTDTRDYPKGIVSCLCDKNKQIRNTAQKLLQKIADKTGYDIFRSIASQQRPAFTKDLNQLFDKYQKGLLNNSSIVSKGVSPVRQVQKKSQNPPTSNRKKSLSKINKSFDRDLEVQDLGCTRSKQLLVQGDEFFAPLKVLTSQRIQRQQLQERVPWRADQIKDNQQQQLKQQLCRLIKTQVSLKMISFDYRKVLDSVLQLIKICKDINQQSHIRETYDILMKWIFIRLWGGNPAIFTIIQVLPPVMSILEKKRIMLTDCDVDLTIAIIREYFISAFMNGLQVSQSLYTIARCLIALSSGERVLKKILRQFSLELGSIHRHVRRDTNSFYRDGLAKIIKHLMMEYIGNEDTLEQASKIKQLKNDNQFLDMLFKRFHENVLSSFGFKQHMEKEKEKSVQKRQSKLEIPSHPPPANNRIVSQKVVPQVVIPLQNNFQSNKMQDSKNQQRDNSVSRKSSYSKQPVPQTQKKNQNDFDLSIYPAPHPSSPLGKNLAKLLPPNQTTINFFTALLMENGQKISNELVTHAKIIFGSILKSVTQILAKRSEYSPEKIVNQINLLQQAIKCKNIIKNIGELLFHATNFALTQLVYEDQNKSLIYEDLRDRGIDYKIQNFIKVINGVMLRILQNASPQQTTDILFSLLIKHTRCQLPSQKTIYLIIKCIVRVSGTFVNQCSPENIRSYLLKVNEYISIVQLSFPLQDFNPPNNQKLKPQDNLINSIKNTLGQLCKSQKSNIWVHYEKAMAEAKYNDQHISSYIQYLNIPYPQKQRSTQNQQLKKINEFLSKSKTFDVGIEKLKKYVQAHPQFSPLQYFTSLNYDQKFITMVMNSLEGSINTSFYRKTPTKIQTRQENKSQNRHDMPSNQGNIQEKIRKLKMKFQQLQPKGDETPNSSSRRLPQEDKNQERAQQIKRRIDQMKSKMTTNYTRSR